MGDYDHCVQCSGKDLPQVHHGSSAGTLSQELCEERLGDWNLSQRY